MKSNYDHRAQVFTVRNHSHLFCAQPALSRQHHLPDCWSLCFRLYPLTVWQKQTSSMILLNTSQILLCANWCVVPGNIHFVWITCKRRTYHEAKPGKVFPPALPLLLLLMVTASSASLPFRPVVTALMLALAPLIMSIKTKVFLCIVCWCFLTR